MCAIIQDPDRPVLMHYFVEETTVQLKACQKKGSLINRIDAVGCVVLEALESKKDVTNFSVRISRLACRRRY